MTQKDAVFRRIAPGLAAHSIATCLVPYPTPSRRACETIQSIARTLGAGLFWFADLDPIGLTAFEFLRATTGPRQRRVTYVGIDDRWLAALERQGALEGRVLAMERSEKTHFELLASFAEDLRALVGERSFALLSSGKKLEVEGLMSVSPTFLDRTAGVLARRIRGRRQAMHGK